MSEEKLPPPRPPRVDLRSPWVLDTRELARHAGLSRSVHRSVPLDTALGVPDVIVLPKGTEIELDLLIESVVEGVLLTGTASVTATGNCSRCLDPIDEDIDVDFTELYAYPGSTTEATTDEDEISRLVDNRIELESLVCDALVLAMPLVPLCEEDCQGLCVECGVKWADLEPGHGHEKIDPRWAALVERFDETPSSEDPASGPGKQA
ncbi:YceD family protein [Amycolatopsis sp.]|jgi:uncharacterized protein|uniref:YceD family protein n=1 Tax=Amycolatopsis sp. TaxID=37632 RepID=UPI00262B4EAD|nr:YceD family protein [Amycolatopsis sp.]